MAETCYVTDHKDFLNLRVECESIILKGERLPKMVFRSEFHFYVFERGYVTLDGFPKFLLQMSNIYSDDAVNYITLDPDPEASYYDQFGFFGAATFDKRDILSKYREMMLRPDKRGSFCVVSNVGFFWGQSLNWAIFCDRVSWELCVLGCRHKLLESQIEDVRFLAPNELKTFITGQYHWKPETALAFLQEFANNYLLTPCGN